MADVPPSPLTGRGAHVATDRGARFAEIIGRVAEREAARDPETGLLPTDAARPAPRGLDLDRAAAVPRAVTAQPSAVAHCS